MRVSNIFSISFLWNWLPSICYRKQQFISHPHPPLPTVLLSSLPLPGFTGGESKWEQPLGVCAIWLWMLLSQLKHIWEQYQAKARITWICAPRFSGDQPYALGQWFLVGAEAFLLTRACDTDSINEKHTKLFLLLKAQKSSADLGQNLCYVSLINLKYRLRNHIWRSFPVLSSHPQARIPFCTKAWW